MARIWLLGGIATLTLALLFAVILCSGVRFKKFFRAAIYLPNIISAVALATMWIQYVFNYDFGMLNGILKEFGLDSIKWLGSDMKFWSMLLAYIFGATGYFMLIFISGIERIPVDLYEASTIDGAGKVRQFFSITMPLLKGITKTNITFWTITTTSFFLWSKMFLRFRQKTPPWYRLSIFMTGFLVPLLTLPGMPDSARPQAYFFLLWFCWSIFCWKRS